MAESLSMQARKRALREEIRRAEARMTHQERFLSDRQIAEQVQYLPGWDDAPTICCFVGTGREIDTRPILEAVLSRRKWLCVPRCLAKGGMEMKRIQSFAELSPGTMGIPEPPEGNETVRPEEIGLLIVPCVTCDYEGRRLGRGGGYYDRYLARYNGPTALLCRERLIREEIPMEAHDRQVLPVLTERGLYWPVRI